MNGNSTEYAAGVRPWFWGLLAIGMLVGVGFSIVDRDWEEAFDCFIMALFAWIIGGYRQREVDAEKQRALYGDIHVHRNPGDIR